MADPAAGSGRPAPGVQPAAGSEPHVDAAPAGQDPAGLSPAGQDPAAVPVTAEPVGDEDQLPTGPRRILVAFYAIFALAATARAVVQLSTAFDQAPLAYLLSLFSGIVYLGATLGLVTERRWSRPLAWASCGTELVGVLVIGVASLVDHEAFPRDTVWSRFGSGYGYFPVLLPLLGLLWLRYSRPGAPRD
ncbi:hypothetical protein [Nakamurella endophytica]|uniref:Integral membrane protein n=1 Tax=Nakamurella endophytica TaxID=1748367 RepID=A0A917SY64_9ACTN|nr:hypothetical protein [Nakamurella endophytica]GGM02641.1 hypothetical protein GCM10011594_23440 [Nakamurella endophytica]